MNTQQNHFNFSKKEREVFNVKTAAGFLKIAPATLKNWVKKGWLPCYYAKSEELCFHKKDLQSVRQKVLNGSFQKLNQRANKTYSHKTFVPEEYTQNKSSQEQFYHIVSYIKKHSLNTPTALFFLSLNFLKNHNMLSQTSVQNFISKRNLKCSHPQIQKEIAEWLAEIDIKQIKKPVASFLLNCDLPQQKDSLGVIYQSLLREGAKSFNGSYYTPLEVVQSIVKDHTHKGFKVWDPCCGTGQFLLAFAEVVKDPLKIYGMDQDSIAVRIARLNICLKFRDKNFIPRIFVGNTLFYRDCLNYSFFNSSFKDMQDFDVIATNPPWGAKFLKTESEKLKNNYPEINSRESFSYFIHKSLSLLKNKGVASFILPEAILNVKAHKDIRRLILEKSCIIKIVSLGRVFQNVFTPVIRMDLRKISDKKITRLVLNPDNFPKRKPDKKTYIPKNHKVLLSGGKGGSYPVKQIRWALNLDFIFDISSTPYEQKILDKIYKTKHTTLKNQADWALGIVTGNNSQFLCQNPKKGYEPVYKGTDIKKFVAGPPSHYIQFQPDKFQQVAPVTMYRTGEKLIYRFISKKLVFAYDDQKRLTLNSANIVIPKIRDYPIKVILALFNSSLYQFIFEKKFFSLKVLRSHIEALPLPLWSKSAFTPVLKTVNSLLKDPAKKQKKELLTQMDYYIMRQFHLSQKEQNHILSLKR